MVATYYQNVFNVVSLLNLFIILFLYGRILLFLVDSSYDLNRFWFLSYIYFDSKVINEVILHSNLYVLSLNLGIVFIYYKKHVKNFSYDFRKLRNSNLVLGLFYVISVIFLIKNVIEFKYVIQNGYLSFYDGGFSEINYYSAFIKYSHVLFVPIFSFIISHKLKRKKIVFILTIFVILSVISSLKGARGLFILPLLFSLWYYFRFYKTRSFTISKIFSLKFASLIFIVIFMSFFLKNLRSEGNSSGSEGIIANIPELILSETGKTIHIMSAYYENRDNLAYDYPYMLEPIFYPYFYFTNFEILTGGQTKELVEIRNSFDDRLTYYLNRNYYLTGGGLGSSFAAESLQLGFIMGGFVCFLIGNLIGYYMKNISNKWFLYLSPIIIQHIIFLARNNAFPNLISISKHLFMYLLILLMYDFIKFLRNQDLR
jgi:oligosaccharide repeat unit polymerase